jgi:DNA-binding NarL/FixJ family response regulator
MALVDSLAGAIPERELADNFAAKAALHLPAALRGRTGRNHIDGLTAREADVAKLIANGMTNREIADELVLGVRTIESHVANAMAKLGFTTRSQLAAWAAEHGLLDSGT